MVSKQISLKVSSRDPEIVLPCACIAVIKGKKKKLNTLYKLARVNHMTLVGTPSLLSTRTKVMGCLGLLHPHPQDTGDLSLLSEQFFHATSLLLSRCSK